MPRIFAIALTAWLTLFGLPSHAQEQALDWFEAADRIGAVLDDPPARPVLNGDDIVGYVFSSAAVSATTGYGGKPLDLLIGIDLDARIAGVQILEEHEPILATGRTRDDLDQFVLQFAGRDLRGGVELVDENAGTLDAVSGATITSLILSDAAMTSARLVARAVGILDQGGIDLDSFERKTWQDLQASGAIVRHDVTIGEAQSALDTVGGRLFPEAMGEFDDGDRLVEIYVALATPTMIGRNLLGAAAHDRWRAEHQAGDQLIWIGGDGRYSFKGTAWRREGRFDRIRIIQGDRRFALEARTHSALEAIAAEGAPELREHGLFTLPAASGFRGDEPFTLDLAVFDHADATKSIILPIAYQLPGSLIVKPPTTRPVWREVWSQRILDIVTLCIALLVLTVMLVLEDEVAKKPRLWRIMRTGFLLFTVFWLGLYATAQLSVVNVLTFADALRHDFAWDRFLIEPLIFILWSFLAVALLFWGRGVFCGWLCPFGALQELLFGLARRLRLPSFELPFAVHERLRAVKFLAFLGLVAVSLGSVEMAHRLAEIEPFKTVIVLKFNHAWPFVAYAVALLVASLFIQRVFCRYLCPLGAALALPARLRQFEWLKRRWQCGQRCHICAGTCPVRAIQPNGEIHPGECIYCLRCQINYFDDTTCPPLIERRRRAMARASAGRAD